MAPARQFFAFRWHGFLLTTILGLALLILPLAGCGGSATNGDASGVVHIVAAENFWGSIAAQVGGAQVDVKSIITSPDTDPHDYEATPADARLIADAEYVIVNGAGYDPWLNKLLDANPVAGRKVLNIGDLVGRKAGDNPHLWYNPTFVLKTADQITADLKALDASDAASFDQQNATFKTINLKTYNDLIASIKAKYTGQPIGSTESIFVDMAAATELNLTTPPAFMKAVSEGEDISPADKATFEDQIAKKQIKVLVFNRQNSTPDTDGIRQKAIAAGIPVVNVTETLDPANVSFQEWQDAQLQYLLQALEDANAA